jgi:H+/Cl- antiporter ClcA
MNLGIGLVWPNPPEWQPFSGSWTIVVIMTIAGFIVGLIHHFTVAEQLNYFAGMVKGRLDPKPVPASLLVSLVSLIGGFSVGPEAPTGFMAAGLGTWLSERRNLSEEVRKSNILGGVAGAFGGLFTSPFAALMIIMELPHAQSAAYYSTLLIVAIAAVLGFSLFFGAAGDVFAGVLRVLDLPDYDLALWHLAVAVVLGIAAVPFALLFGVLMKLLKRLVAPLDKLPIIRSTLAGFLLGLLGMALPLTLFLGTNGLAIVTEQAAEIGAGLLILIALAKILAVTGALSTGFIGGSIFPLLFVGATLGSTINLFFPQIPLALTVGVMMAAVPGAILPIPISLGIIVLLIVGTPLTEAVPVLLASLTAFSVTYGLGLLGGE